jgi:hypothetical protein
MTTQGDAVRNYPKIAFRQTLKDLNIGFIGELADRTQDAEQDRDSAPTFEDFD